MRLWLAGIVVSALAFSAAMTAQSSKPQPSQSPSPNSAGSSSSKDKKHDKVALDPEIDSGAVVNGVYRNRALGLTCKIPAGWVLRTEEMNAREEEDDSGADGVAPHPREQKSSSPQRPQRSTESKVLLAAFSRPPGAQGEDVNASILIAAEPVQTYPGLTEAVQYLGVLTEVAKQQGFTEDAGPYEIAIGTKALVREDFHKDVGTRVMRQSTLAMLAKEYAVSITLIGGTEDEVDELLDGVEFSGASK